MWKDEIKIRLAGLKLDPAREAEIVEELAQHLDNLYAELRAGGATEEEAARVELVELNSSELLSWTQWRRCALSEVQCSAGCPTCGRLNNRAA